MVVSRDALAEIVRVRLAGLQLSEESIVALREMIEENMLEFICLVGSLLENVIEEENELRAIQKLPPVGRLTARQVQKVQTQTITYSNKYLVFDTDPKGLVSGKQNEKPANDGDGHKSAPEVA